MRRKADNSFIFDPPPLGSVLWLPGLPGAGSIIYDRSLYGNHGTITGATGVRLSSGLWVLSFDGTDDIVDLGYNRLNQQLSGAAGITAFGWVNLSTVGDGWIHQILVNGNSAGIAIYTASVGGKVTAGGRSVGTDGWGSATSVTAMTASAWHFIGAILNFTGDSATVVLDGEATAAAATFANNTYTPGTPTAGSQETLGANKTAGGITEEITGKIGLWRVISGVLTTAQLEQIRSRERHLFGV